MPYFSVLVGQLSRLSPVVNTLAGLSFSPVDVGDVGNGGDHHLCLAQAQPELLIVIQLVATC